MEIKRRIAYVLFTISLIFFIGNYILWLSIFGIFGENWDNFFVKYFFNVNIPIIFQISVILVILIFFNLKYIKYNYLRIIVIFILILTLLFNAWGAALSTFTPDDSSTTVKPGF